MGNFSMHCGIYLLHWEGDDRVYIGQSQDIYRRYKTHCRDLFKNRHTNFKLTDKYTVSGELPKLEILELTSTDKLLVLEEYYMKEFDSIKNGYNIIDAGICGRGTSSSHSKHSRFTILKVLVCLYKYSMFRKEAALRCKVPESLVKTILSGKAHHWLKTEYPNEFSIAVQQSKLKRGKAISRIKPFKLLSPEGVEYHVSTSIKEFCRSIPEFASSIDSSAFCIGQMRLGKYGKNNSYKKWTLVK